MVFGNSIVHWNLKRMCVLFLIDGSFYKCWLGLVGLGCWILDFLDLLLQCLINWERGEWSLPTITVDLRFLFFIYIRFCFIYCSPMWCMYIFNFYVLVNWLSVIPSYLSLSLVIFFCPLSLFYMILNRLKLNIY